MRFFFKLLAAGIILFAALQLVRPSIPTQPATAELQVPAAVHSVLDNSCYSCHSNERRLSWFDQIVPGYWLVRHDVLTARRRLNFSTLGAQPAAAQRAALFEAVNMVQLGAMPLPQFLRLHPQARVSSQSLATLKTYLAPWTTPPDPPATPPTAPANTSLSAVPPELNGLAFDPSFPGWKLLSITDRGDNNTFRFILGNDVAQRAIQSGNISPWPDGARLAKVAWRQQLGADGLVHPGQFIQVELMVKDAQQNKATEGWAWGRWRGASLKPYGDSAAFVAECTGCHRPLHGNDFVYTLPLTTAPGRDDLVNNAAAVLPANLPFQPLGWNAITLFVDRDRHTMSTLFGNDVALQSVRASHASGLVTYPPGSVLALVTWAQRDDPHWFGARIPGAPLSVEVVQLPANSAPPLYTRYAGASLSLQSVPATEAAARATSIASLTPAWLP